MKTAIRLVEKGLVPKPLLRRGIRRLLRARFEQQLELYGIRREDGLKRFVQGMRDAPVALVPEKANEQHYEVPPEFFRLVLGRHLKYSSAYYPDEHTTLDQAELAMLELTAEHADLQDGQDVLELGCGWGSLTLFMAERYPNSRILAVSNSAPQRESILADARARGLSNVDVVTCDMNGFDTERRFDRVVSVEMFEHMRNWEELLGRIAGWVRPDARLFLHVFAHERFAYLFEEQNDSDWMSKYFFTGGMMPSHDLLDHLDIPFEVEERWAIPGTHYARTAEDWLRNQERRRDQVMPVLAATYGEADAPLWFQRWRIFFLACAELFDHEGGSQWLVSHARLRLRGANGAR